MWQDLEDGYIPGCPECQRNKGQTTKPIGPLHPLPVPEKCCDLVAIDFIGQLPLDDGFNTILTITDCLGSDIQLIPTTATLTAEQLAKIFFEKWYCENGLPLDIVSDRDKLFVLHFWKALHELNGIKLKLLSGYHPETDGASEQTNKMVIQCLRFRVECDQKGWVKALLKVQFDIMNTINKSTGFSPFQLHFGRPACMLPPIVNRVHEEEPILAMACKLAMRMAPIEMEAQDNLIGAKIDQAAHTNEHRFSAFPFRTGDRVVLSTKHQRHDYKSSEHYRAAKFMPRYDGPYHIVDTDEHHLTVMLDLPEKPHIFLVFHTSEVQPFTKNNTQLFPQQALVPPEPVTIDGYEEFFIDKIVDQHQQGCGIQYCVLWRGEGPEGDKWLPAKGLENCKALDKWLEHQAQAPPVVMLCYFYDTFSLPPVAFPTGVLTHLY